MDKPAIETTPEEEAYSASVRAEWQMECPKCKTAHSLRISAEVTVDLLPNGTEVDLESDTTWEDNSYCACGHCNHWGDVKDFKIPEAEPADPDLLALATRYRHLLSELHGGNSFSKDHLWQALQEAEAVISKAAGGAT